MTYEEMDGLNIGCRDIHLSKIICVHIAMNRIMTYNGIVRTLFDCMEQIG
jgi:hypothetical protein